MAKLIRNVVFVFVILIVLSSVVYSSEIRVREETSRATDLEFVPGEILVKFKESAGSGEVENILQELEVERIGRIEELEIHRVKIPATQSVQGMVSRFKQNPLVEFAEPNYIVQASFVPNDPFYCLQWHLDDSLEWDPVNGVCVVSSNPFGGIHMETAWDVTTGNSSVIVAVLDTGVAYERFSDPNPAGCYKMNGQLGTCHNPVIDEYFQAPDLAGTTFTILAGSDIVNSDDHPNDDVNHGTHVTGTIAQSTNNGLGVAGVAFDTTVMPVKVLDATGSAPSSVVANGIVFATNNGAKVISMSLGSPSPSSTIESAVNFAYGSGVTVIAACGNGGSGSGCDYPAAFTNVISVGATQYDETRAPYSNFGSNLDVMAPGGRTNVDQNNDSFADGVLQQTFDTNADTSDFAYWFFQGTSMATPHVAGVAALLLSLNSSLTPDDIRDILQSTADDLGAAGRDDTFGWGLINAFAAVNSLSSSDEFISITLIDYPIEFGSKDPGTNDNTGAANPYTIRIEPETTINVDIYQKGDDFAGTPSTLSISNMSWFNSNNSGGAFLMQNSYQDSVADISPGTNVSVYYWLDVPAGQLGGEYNTTIFIKGVETGMSP